jgi:hypothetical protein
MTRALEALASVEKRKPYALRPGDVHVEGERKSVAFDTQRRLDASGLFQVFS